MRAPLPILFPLLIILYLFTLLGQAAAAGVAIREYRPLFVAGRDRAGEQRIAIRSFSRDQSPFLLLVDPFSLRTSVAEEGAFTRTDDGPALDGSPYLVSLKRYDEQRQGVANGGVVHSASPARGIFLTVDMCPSKRGFEERFFAFLAGFSGKGGKTPVAVAISGNWLLAHGEEFGRIVDLDAQGSLAVTWVNHSLTHPYDPKAPLERNFLLTPGVDFDREVLDTERLLLERGLLPSPFFRFPGLVADGRLMRRLRELGLIAVGSDAWLAKGETPVDGSIVLVHGNGNEPSGIAMAMRFLREGRGVRLLPLAEALGATDRIRGD